MHVYHFYFSILKIKLVVVNKVSSTFTKGVKTMANLLFQKGKIGNLELSNHLLMSAMVTNYCTEDGKPTERFIAYHEARTKGGIGLESTGACYVTMAGRGFPNQAGLHKDDNIPAWREFTNRIHAAGGKCSTQLYHAGRQTSTDATGLPLEAPSAIPCPLMGGLPVELTIERIHEIVREYGEAARRAKEAGFDAVEIHGAHGYLINEFQSPYSNKRTDEYGGSVENRERFPLEVLRSVRAAVGPDFPIIYKISAEEGVEGGLTIEDTCEFAKKLVDNGVSAILTSRAVYENVQYQIPPVYEDFALNVENAGKIKAAIGGAVPVSVVGRIRGYEMAEKVLESGKADFITMGRPLLCDPDLPNKMKEGRFDEIRECLSCNQGCADFLLAGEPITCMLNPVTGHEFETDLSPVSTPKTVLILGGGAGGMECARIAATRGHKVTLIEKSDHLGGQLNYAKLPPHKESIGKYVAFQTNELARLGVDVKLNTTMTAEDVKDFGADEVVLAVGSHPAELKVPGADGKNVITARETLAGASVGKNVAIIGGGLVGIDTAEYLVERGHTVTIIEMQSDIGMDMGLISKMSMLEHYGKRDDFDHITNAKLTAIGENSITVEHNGEAETIDGIDTVVMAIGSKPDTELRCALDESGIVYHTVGDVKKVGQIVQAVRESFDLAMNF